LDKNHDRGNKELCLLRELKTVYGHLMPLPLCNGLAHPACSVDESMLARDRHRDSGTW